MSGQLTECKSFVASSSGDNVILIPRISKLKIFSIIYSPDADITGEIQVKLGSRVLSGARNPKTGAIYGFNLHPDFVEGKIGEQLVVNLPSTTAVTVDVAWREAPLYTARVE